jgi:hypothetical protein
MDINTIWSGALSAVLGGLWFFIREVARVTEHIDQRFNKLEEKIDRLLQAGR